MLNSFHSKIIKVRVSVFNMFISLALVACQVEYVQWFYHSSNQANVLYSFLISGAEEG